MSRFYFLLPLEKPTCKLPDLFQTLAEELHRAGVEKISGRILADAVRDKFPYYGSDKIFKSLPRRAMAFMSRSELFEKNGCQGRSNLFRYKGDPGSISSNNQGQETSTKVDAKKRKVGEVVSSGDGGANQSENSKVGAVETRAKKSRVG